MSNHPVVRYISVAGISLLMAGGASYVSAQADAEQAAALTQHEDANESAADEAAHESTVDEAAHEAALDEDLMEEITVEGFRRSLRNAVEAKRMAEGITDSIYAEDIGKSADQNIADALQRVTGVSIQREDGEGTSITVRGAGPDLNNIKLNGITLNSGSENQTVDLSAFSSDILSHVEVIKTASADHDEGSLGATVRLNTFKPLNVSEDRRVLEVQQRFNDLASEEDHKISGAYSHKFLDDTLGIAGTIFSETQTVRKDQYGVNKYKARTVAQARDSQTGEILTDVTALTHDQTRYQSFMNVREREGFTSTIQFAPTSATEIQLDITYSDLYVETDDNSIQTIGSLDPNLDTDPVEDWYVVDQRTNFFTRALDRGAKGRTMREQSGVETENRIFSFSATHEIEDFVFSFKGGVSKTNTEDDYYTRVNTNNFNFVNREVIERAPSNLVQPVGYDCTSGRCQLVTGTHIMDLGADPGTGDNVALTSYNPDDVNAIHLQQAATRDRRMSDDTNSFFADVDWDVEFAGINKVEFGLKYEERSKHVVNQWVQYEGDGNATIGDTGDVLPRGIPSIQLSEVTDGNSIFNDFMRGLGFGTSNTTDGWATVNARKAFAEIFSDRDDITFVTDRKQDRSIDLENTAAYVKFNFSYLDDKLSGNFGIRYVNTLVESSGFSGVNLQNFNVLSPFEVDPLIDPASPTYNPDVLTWNPGQKLANLFDESSLEDPDDFSTQGENTTEVLLPSFTLNWLISEDMIGRLALSKTMARPRIDSLQPGFSLTENIWGTNSWGKINNPALEPLESKNLDVSWEWYFAEGGLLSATLFYKDMKNFEETESISVFWRDFRGQSDLTGLTALSALMAAPDESTCMPDRYSIWHQIGVRSGCDIVTVEANRNGSGATSQGVELTYNQNYHFLPGIWSGLGVALNYTYSDSETEAEAGTLTTELAAMPLARVPRHTANATLFWERNGHLIRLSYNYRTDSLEDRSFFNGAKWNEGGERLDLSATWKINDNFSLTLSGVNLTDEISRQYYTSLTDPGIEPEGNALDGDVPTSRTLKEWQTGRLFRLGLRASF